MSATKRNINRGFTLVELLVTISIFVILTGVVLFGQSKFDSTILLTNLAYDTALTIRQAQNYGINVKEFNNGTSYFSPYGVHFDINSPKSFILFADLDPDLGFKPVGNGLYDGSSAECLSLPEDGKSDGCVNRYSIKRGNFISKLCVDNDDYDTCGGVDSLDIVFKRPNPDALIQANPGITSATIFLSGTDDSIRKVKVQSNGLIEIK